MRTEEPIYEGKPRIAFISREARDAVREWLRVRRQYLEAAAGKSHRYAKSREDPRVFPFTDANARFMWRNSLKKAGLKEHDERTNRTTLHPHVLRKFFRSRMGAVIPVDVVEALMGHEGYLTEVYRRYSREELAQFYLKGEHTVLIFTEAAEIGRLRREIEERNQQLQALVNGLTAENLELRSRLAQLELQHAEFRKRVLKEVQELKKMILDLMGEREE
ncbi:tyrosine-type recombinase/integrase [Candidatus Bathyarchaeota archaeon]|nr:tyrosine-type recombinase/integrase [Candidatus Bathyarchaeota archaeon]